MGPALGSAQLGMMVMASDIAQLPTSEILAPAGTVLFAGLAAARNTGTDTTAMTFRIAVSLLMLLAPLAIATSATSGYIVATLLGQEWSGAQGLVAILAWLGLFAPFTYVCSVSLTASGKVRLNFLIIAAASLVKIVVLSLAAATHVIETVALSSLAITAVETAIFVAVVCREGGRLRPVLSTAFRVAISGAAGAAAMLATGAAWQATTLPPLTAMLHGALLGCLGLLVYAATLSLAWWLAGRPDGPETDVLGFVTPVIRRIVSRPEPA